MNKICEINTKDVERIFNNLSNEEERKKMMLDALYTGGKELAEETKSELLRVLPNANKGEKYGKPMTSGIKVKKDKNYDEVIVHIMGDFRLKWFEMGTKERYLKKPIEAKSDTRYKFRTGSSNAGGNPYRGKIKALNFFEHARANSDVVNTIVNTLQNKINKILK